MTPGRGWLVLALLAGGCAEGGDDTADPCARRPALSYDNFGRSHMEKHCTGCHSSLLPEGRRQDAPMGVDLDTWAGVLQWGDRVQARSTGDSPTMPPGGGPGADEVAMLEEWLVCDVIPTAALLAEEGR